MWAGNPLYYADNGLGGATMTNIGEQGARDFARLGIMVRSVENDVTTIDAFLPPDLAIDPVKIDIEGHEPLAMRGMARTIARSPRLRFIIEFDERFLAHTVSAPEFLDEIHKLGFRVCKILQRSNLELVRPGEPLNGHLELLLTRTPEEDIDRVAAQLRRLPFQARRWLRGTAGDLRRLWHRL